MTFQYSASFSEFQFSGDRKGTGVVFLTTGDYSVLNKFSPTLNSEHNDVVYSEHKLDGGAMSLLNT